MSTTFLATITFCFLIITLIVDEGQAEWIISNSPLPIAEQRMSIGYYNNTVTLIGGFFAYNILEYNVQSAEFINYGSASPIKSWGQGQFWTQTNDVLFTIDTDKPFMNTYDLSTKIFTQNWMNVNFSTPVGSYGCLSSLQDVLFIVGGYWADDPTLVKHHSILQIFNPSTYQWTFGPNLNGRRSSTACLVTPNNNKLYAIAGFDGDTRLNTIEYISAIGIESNAWYYTNQDLTEGITSSRAVSYNNYIYIIGGLNNDNDPIDLVHIIDIDTNDVTVSAEKLAYNISFASPIIILNRIYVFGGFTTNAISDKFQYIDLAIEEPTTDDPTTSPTTVQPTTDTPTMNPTNAPSKNPTPAPTDYSDSPTTIAPTIIPTISPTDNPTISTTDNPTTSPSSNPSVSAMESSYKPSISPTKSPFISTSTETSSSSTRLVSEVGKVNTTENVLTDQTFKYELYNIIVTTIIAFIFCQ